MFVAIAVTKYGFPLTMGTKMYEAKEQITDNFEQLWTEWARGNTLSRDIAYYCIAELQDGIEMTRPPEFKIVPLVNLLEKPQL